MGLGVVLGLTRELSKGRRQTIPEALRYRLDVRIELALTDEHPLAVGGDHICPVGEMKRAICLATAALLAMLILAPMALAQDTTVFADGGGGPAPTPTTGGPAILLPAAALLLGSGILTYAILRRR